MPHLRCLGVNDGFTQLVKEFATYEETDGMDLDISIGMTKTNSRNGPVIQATEPVLVTYLTPTQRVLFNQARDANPFFHLMEALWMLQGRNDLAPLEYYVSTFGQFSDDGSTLHGAYGKRWRSWFGYDQLQPIITELQDKPTSRRCVLAMWDACCCEECKPTRVRNGVHTVAKHDLYMALTGGGKDVPCNTHAYFMINNSRLDMTVCNRSNDLILGMLGANVVHFSFLLEYMAAHIGVDVGVYNQFTNNLHVYLENFKPTEWLADTTPNYYTRLPRLNSVKLVVNPERFDKELKVFSEDWLGVDDVRGGWDATFSEPFFQSVAKPMAKAFAYHKVRDYKNALRYASEVMSDDWRIASVNWLRKREARYNKAKDDGVSYEDNRNPYLESELNRIKQESNDAGVKPKEE